MVVWVYFVTATLEQLEKFISNFTSFEDLTHVKKFEILGYFASEVAEKNTEFSLQYILYLYRRLGIAAPSNPSDIAAKAGFIGQDGSYVIGRKSRLEISKFLGSPSKIVVRKNLSDLIPKITDSNEQRFLKETIDCYSVSAFRASVTMMWNLSVYHLQMFILKYKLQEFNNELPKIAPKCKISKITTLDDFSEIKEIQFIEICRAANIISNDVRKVLAVQLDFRNSCAHPSNIIIPEEKASGAIQDLVHNIMLHYKL